MSNDSWANAMKEVESPERDPGLWARCFSEAEGDEARAKAAYIRYWVKGPAAVEALPNRIDARLNPHVTSADQAEAMRRSRAEPSRPQIVKQAKSRGIYIILGLFLGMLGVHNFYAGRLGIGVVQLVVVLLLGWLIIGFVIVGIWVLVELCVVTKDGAGDSFA